MVEYEALLAGLRLLHQLRAHYVILHSDFEVVVGQVHREYQAKGENMLKYLSIAQGLIKQFNSFKIVQIPREDNQKADALSKLTTPHTANQVFVEELLCPSFTSPPIGHIEDEGDTWMTPIRRYLSDGTLQDSKAEARKVQTRAPRYALQYGLLYRRSYL